MTVTDDVPESSLTDEGAARPAEVSRMPLKASARETTSIVLSFLF
jgi:hypothetical protein